MPHLTTTCHITCHIFFSGKGHFYFRKRTFLFQKKGIFISEKGNFCFSKRAFLFQKKGIFISEKGHIFQFWKKWGHLPPVPPRFRSLWLYLKSTKVPHLANPCLPLLPLFSISPLTSPPDLLSPPRRIFKYNNCRQKKLLKTEKHT